MNGKQVKALRSQIRNVVKEILPEVLSGELMTTIEKSLNEKITARLEAIDERQKAIQGYVVRNSAGLPPETK